jgi:hypothetical protein
MRVRSTIPGSSRLLLAAGAVATVAIAPVVRESNLSAQKPEQKKPSISLRANPTAGFSPLRVVLTAELKGGSDDYEEFYCASVEWDWGDDTKSETKTDCDPYESGKSEIKRRYVQEHTFRSINPDLPGAPGMPAGPTQFRVRFLLKQKNKVVGSGQTMVEVRSGMGS